MYGIFTYIWVFLGQILVNIPYMEHMGIGLQTYLSNKIEVRHGLEMLQQWAAVSKWVITPYKWDILGYPLVN